MQAQAESQRVLSNSVVRRVPPELVARIVDLVLVDKTAQIYTHVDAQRDLCALSSFGCHVWRHVAQDRLFRDAVLRNSGRACLFLDTLEEHHELGQAVRTLSWAAPDDMGRSIVGANILDLVPNLVTLKLGASLLVRDEGELFEALKHRRPKISIFEYGFTGTAFFAPVARLLTVDGGWHALQELTLDGILILDNDGYNSPHTHWRHLAPPSCVLRALRLARCTFLPHALEWLLASSWDSLDTLDLRHNDLMAWADTVQLLQDHSPALRHLTYLHGDRAEQYDGRILELFPKLESLTVGDFREHKFLFHSLMRSGCALGSLELRGRLLPERCFLEAELNRRGGPLSKLKSIRLVGPYASETRRIKTLAASLGIDFDTRTSFATDEM